MPVLKKKSCLSKDKAMNQLDVDKVNLAKSYQPILIILLMFFAFVSFGGIGALLGNAISNVKGIDVTSIMEGGGDQILGFSERQSIRWANFISHFFAFTVASFLVAFLYKSKKSVIEFLGLDKGVSGSKIFWSIVALILIFPAIQLIYWLNLQLPLPEWMMEMGKSQDWLVAEVLRMEHFNELFFVLLIAAVAPAIGEELLFRGVVQPQFSKIFNNPHLGVWVTAFIFSAIHMQFAGFFPRFFLGAFLGYLYLWSGSLWLPILIHFIFQFRKRAF